MSELNNGGYVGVDPYFQQDPEVLEAPSPLDFIEDDEGRHPLDVSPVEPKGEPKDEKPSAPAAPTAPAAPKK